MSPSVVLGPVVTRCGLWGVDAKNRMRGLSVHCWVSGMTLGCFSCDAVFVLAPLLGGCVGGVWCV